IIKRPVLYEKSTFAINEAGKYTFDVDPRASKDEIKAAVETIYKVKVVSVNTQVKKHKARRLKYGISKPADSKKAIVSLVEGNTIELF
ncbi:MAG: 50S ribosomal protein L23, partial [Phycisphaerales bacterium]